ncbi:hypothetical protein E2C01_089323 [Portunus trituberculatus]|uniref:Uncharacterized protein n=1 Tax=Portunus trituberculatus TaxID=210409 RepID=A0A5B7JLX7_PORTR|nr:hypothetical protein [Portunus trituberculatus]
MIHRLGPRPRPPRPSFPHRRRRLPAMHERGIANLIEGKIVQSPEFQNWPSVTQQPVIYPAIRRALPGMGEITLAPHIRPSLEYRQIGTRITTYRHRCPVTLLVTQLICSPLPNRVFTLYPTRRSSSKLYINENIL